MEESNLNRCCLPWIDAELLAIVEAGISKPTKNAWIVKQPSRGSLRRWKSRVKTVWVNL
jgi:hypothetical protein